MMYYFKTKTYTSKDNYVIRVYLSRKVDMVKYVKYF